MAHGGPRTVAPRPARAGPREEREIVFILGYWENPAAEKFDPPGSQLINKRTVRPVIDHWLQSANVEAGLRGLRERWDDLLSNVKVSTPDEHTDRMVNVWNAYQCMVTFNLSRSASSYESGSDGGWASATPTRTCSDSFR